MFGDIMVLASPPPLPTVDPDFNAPTQNIQLYEGRCPPCGTLLLKFDTLRGLEQLRSQPNDTQILTRGLSA